MRVMSSFSGQKAGDPYGKVLVFRKVAGERGCGEPALSHPPSGGGGGRAPVRINPASAVRDGHRELRLYFTRWGRGRSCLLCSLLCV